MHFSPDAHILSLLDLKPVYYPLFAAEVLQKLCQELIEQIAKSTSKQKHFYKKNVAKGPKGIKEVQC